MKVHYFFYFLALLVALSVLVTDGLEQLIAGVFAVAFVGFGYLAKRLLYPGDNPQQGL